MIMRLMEPKRVLELAYDGVDFTPDIDITINDIVTATNRYIIPVIGKALYEQLLEGNYPVLMNDYVAPALALYVREVVDAPTAPRSAAGLQRARSMLMRVSDFLDEDSASYPEYEASRNILKRCRINGSNIQIL
ncbi:MAG: hypothetical protein R3Y16_06105 [Rikenellaceae bacterium]